MTSKKQYQVSELVPHSGKMSLLTRISDYGDDWLEAEVDIDASSMFVEEQGVPAWVGVEYMAQTVAAFAGLQEKALGQHPKLGFLLGTRRYNVNVEWFPLGVTLTIRVVREMVAENGLHVFQTMLEANQISAAASLNVFQPENAEQFIKESML
jgi:predicted hotdog family 3-hydroxylacyl-ACP dehydratase